jgi:hypothetical protein
MAKTKRDALLFRLLVVAPVSIFFFALIAVSIWAVIDARSEKAVAGEAPTTAQTHSARVGMPGIGCESLDTFNRVTQLIHGKESPEGDTVIGQVMSSGQCVELTKGEIVQVAQIVGVERIKVRPEGDSKAYWTFWATIDQ